MCSWSLEFSFDVDTENRVIYEKIYGVWRKETANEYHREFMAAVQPLLGAPWAKLVDLINWKTSYPDMVGVVARHLRWCRENGLELSINVLNNTSTFRQLNEMFSGGGTGDISHTFRTRAHAERYLREVWIEQEQES